MNENTKKQRNKNLAKPQEIPSPTYWPIIAAVGITFFFWGFVTSLIISCVGVIVFSIALAGWIGILRQEHEEQMKAKKVQDKNES